MIQAVFFESHGKISGFEISGHAGYAEYGDDIVCASVSSAVQLAANIITEGFGLKADVSAFDNTVKLSMSVMDDKSIRVLNMLKTHIAMLSEDFPKTINITITEV